MNQEFIYDRAFMISNGLYQINSNTKGKLTIGRLYVREDYIITALK